MNMRQGQQHRRNRGRGGHNANHNTNNNNNRKIQNPLARTYHSNGPDGKVSGSPQSIADKYLSLARDALSSGDPVLAENYLQHAEHYNRIILGYREQLAQAHDAANGGTAAAKSEADENSDFPDQDTDSLGRDLSPLPPEPPRVRHDAQPRFDQGPAREGQQFSDRQAPDRQNRPNRDRFGERDRNGERFGPRAQQPAYGPDGQLLQSDRPMRDDRPRDDRSDRPREDRSDRSRDDRNRDRHFRPNGPRGEQYRGDQSRTEPSRDGQRFDNPRYEQGRGDAPRADAGPRESAREVSQETPAVAIVEVPPRVTEVAIAPVTEAPEVRPPRRRERGPALAEDVQPDFLRRPVRRTRRETPAENPVPPNGDPEAT